MAVMRDELNEWLQLVRGDGHVLRERPSLLFQQAANLPDDSAPSRTARRRIDNGIETRAWIRLINKPRRGSALHVTLVGHTRDVHCCAVSPDGSRVISGSADETLRLWDAESGAELGVLARGEGEVMRCAFSRDGLHIAATFRIVEGNIYRNRKIRIWDALSQRVTRDLRVEDEPGSIIALVFLADGRLLSAHYGGSLRVWDLESGALVHVIEAGDSQEQGIADLDVSPSGDRIATLHGAALAGDPYGMNVKVWDGETFHLLAHFQYAERGRPKACAFSLTRDRLVIVGQGLLKGWDTTTWKEIYSVSDHLPLWLTESCAVVGDGIVTVRNRRDIAVFDASTGERRTGWPAHGDGITCCEPFPGRSRVVTASKDRTVRIWNLETGVSAQRAHDEVINHVTFSPDGTRFASAAADKTVKIWETSTGELTNVVKVEGERRNPGLPRRTQGVKFCSFSPDGSRIATWGDSEPSQRITDAETGVDLATASHDWVGTRGAFTADGRAVLTLAPDPKLWDHESGNARQLFPGMRDVGTGSLQSSDYLPGGRFVAAVFYERGVHIFDLHTHRITSYRDLQSEYAVCVVSPDESTILYGGLRIGALTVSLNDGRITRHEILDETRWFKRCAFSADGSRLLTVIAARPSYWDNGVEIRSALPEIVRLWAVPEYTLVAELAGPSDIVDGYFSPAGDHLILLENSRVRWLRVHDLRDCAVLGSNLALSSLALSPDGRHVAVGSANGDLLLLALENLPTS